MKERSYFVYILKCSDNSYYTGITNNLERRLFEHREGLDPGCYTYDRRPLELMHSEEFQDVIDALNREKQIKGWSRAKKEALINGAWERLKALAKTSGK